MRSATVRLTHSCASSFYKLIIGYLPLYYGHFLNIEELRQHCTALNVFKVFIPEVNISIILILEAVDYFSYKIRTMDELIIKLESQVSNLSTIKCSMAKNKGFLNRSLKSKIYFLLLDILVNI